MLELTKEQIENGKKNHAVLTEQLKLASQLVMKEPFMLPPDRMKILGELVTSYKKDIEQIESVLNEAALIIP